jgi:PAS domain-containing protein
MASNSSINDGTDYTGLSPEEAHGWGWKVTIHPQDLASLIDKWQALLASGEAGEIEARRLRFDGEFRWFLFRGSPLRRAGRVARPHTINNESKSAFKTL